MADEKKDNTDAVSKGKTCLSPECEAPARWKGICATCYAQARKLIEDEKTTWEDLYDMGLVRLPGTKFLDAFKAAKDKAAGS